VSYRRLGIPSLEALVGAGVYYGAAVSEAQALSGQRVCVVGGGNSAGQAAVHLAKYAAQVTILVRSASLANSMSGYLIGEIEAGPRIDIRYRTELAGGRGESQLEAVMVVDRASGVAAELPVAARSSVTAGLRDHRRRPGDRGAPAARLAPGAATDAA
jgi:thioredoxin reductase (NADPH)